MHELFLSFSGGQFEPVLSGQFGPESGGQFAPESGGQLRPERGGHIDRNFHFTYRYDKRFCADTCRQT